MYFNYPEHYFAIPGNESYEFFVKCHMLIYSASHILGAVLPCFFDIQDNGRSHLEPHP